MMQTPLRQDHEVKKCTATLYNLTYIYSSRMDVGGIHANTHAQPQIDAGLIIRH